MDAFQLIHGDSFDVLRDMRANSAHACVTDPPYGIGFMGKAWDQQTPIKFEAFSQAWARDMLRVLRPGAHLVAFASTRTYHRMVCGIEDAGFEIRDQLAWVFGSGFPKSHNLEGDWEGWGTALKPAYEPIVLARKPFEGTVAANVAKWGCGALNVAACTIGNEMLSASVRGVSKLGTFEGADGNVTPARAGRWPANLVHDGSAEVVGLFPEEAGGASVAQCQAERGLGGIWSESQGKPAGVQHADSGSAARFFYCAKASAADREAGLEGFAASKCNDGRDTPIDNAYQRGETPRKNTHPTVKPTELMRWLVRLVTPPGGRVIDPFMGSGSTGRACALEGFEFTGIEREAEYMPIARARINEARGELFAA